MQKNSDPAAGIRYRRLQLLDESQVANKCKEEESLQNKSVGASAEHYVPVGAHRMDID